MRRTSGGRTLDFGLTGNSRRAQSRFVSRMTSRSRRSCSLTNTRFSTRIARKTAMQNDHQRPAASAPRSACKADASARFTPMSRSRSFGAVGSGWRQHSKAGRREHTWNHYLGRSNGVGSANRTRIFVASLQTLLANLFQPSDPANAIEPADQTAPPPGVSKNVMSA